ncbi:MAG: outer membrane protein assembly factor BamD [Tatlockia sp.]|nr:outer membrane protein assembly factor BamD [Tatlockia sp.]
MKLLKVLVLISLLLSMTGCKKWFGRDDEDSNPFQGTPAKQLFEESQQAIKKEQYDSAAKRLEALESMYPFSDYAEKAQTDLIYAYYKKADYPSATATAERYIHLYPRAKNVDYAYYMKGLANFQQNRGALANMLPLDESWRDPGTQSQAYSDFATLVQKFPDSRYKANALQRMTYLRNMFAKRELNTSRYYFERKMYVASAQRASYLVENYPQAPSAREGLSLLYNANIKLGLQKAAADAFKVYQSTYHQNPPIISTL